MSEQMIKELSAKQAISETLARYCRGLDRMDKAMAYSVFHPNAKVDYYGIFQGSGHAFVDWVWQAHAVMQSHSHQITNTLIQVDGDTAVSEAYVTVTLQFDSKQADNFTETLARGRYLDRWCRYQDRWVIDSRLHIVDAQSTYQPSDMSKAEESRRDVDDPSFKFFQQAGFSI